MKRGYDEKCLELAEYFLSDEKFPDARKKVLADQLAQEIQTTIEDFLQYMPQIT